MSKRLSRPLFETIPVPFRRFAGIGMLTLTLWMASFLALFR
jgi:hypothetical protein